MRGEPRLWALTLTAALFTTAGIPPAFGSALDQLCRQAGRAAGCVPPSRPTSGPPPNPRFRPTVQYEPARQHYGSGGGGSGSSGVTDAQAADFAFQMFNMMLRSMRQSSRSARPRTRPAPRPAEARKPVEVANPLHEDYQRILGEELSPEALAERRKLDLAPTVHQSPGMVADTPLGRAAAAGCMSKAAKLAGSDEESAYMLQQVFDQVPAAIQQGDCAIPAAPEPPTPGHTNLPPERFRARIGDIQEKMLLALKAYSDQKTLFEDKAKAGRENEKVWRAALADWERRRQSVPPAEKDAFEEAFRYVQDQAGKAEADARAAAGSASQAGVAFEQHGERMKEAQKEYQENIDKEDESVWEEWAAKNDDPGIELDDALSGGPDAR